jgi:hypothetical protein
MTVTSKSREWTQKLVAFAAEPPTPGYNQKFPDKIMTIASMRAATKAESHPAVSDRAARVHVCLSREWSRQDRATQPTVGIGLEDAATEIVGPRPHIGWVAGESDFDIGCVGCRYEGCAS